MEIVRNRTMAIATPHRSQFQAWLPSAGPRRGGDKGAFGIRGEQGEGGSSGRLPVAVPPLDDIQGRQT